MGSAKSKRIQLTILRFLLVRYRADFDLDNRDRVDLNTTLLSLRFKLIEGITHCMSTTQSLCAALGQPNMVKFPLFD